MKKYLLTLGALFMVLISLSAFSNSKEEKVPNELIVNNPKKEVTTVESPKNREHGEMNISVTKINPIEIVGREVNGKLEFNLPEKVNPENKILVTQDVSHIQGLVKLNGKEPRNLLGKKKIELPVPFTLEKKDEKTKVIVDKPKDKKDLYIAVMNGGKVEKVYKNMLIIPRIFYKYLGSVTIRLDKRLKQVAREKNYKSLSMNSPYGGELNYVKGTSSTKTRYEKSIDKLDAISSNDYFLGGGLDVFVDIQGTQKYLQRGGSGRLVNSYDDSDPIRRKYSASFWIEDSNRNLLRASEVIGLYPNSHASTTFYIPSSYNDDNMFYEIKDGSYHINNGNGISMRVYMNYVGEDALEGTGTLDLSNININNEVAWSKSVRKQSGYIRSSNNLINMYISSGKLFDWLSQIGNENIDVGRLEIKSSLGENLSTSLEAGYGGSLRLNNNTFTLTNTEFRISKTTNNTNPISYTIKIYAGRGGSGEALYGTLNLKITNATPAYQNYNIGTVKFNVDSRINSQGEWIFKNGDISAGINDNRKNYSELVAVSGSFTNHNASINRREMPDRSSAGTFTSNGTRYLAFKKNSNDWVDAAAIPETSISGLLEKLVISNKNRNLTDNQFKLTDTSGNTYTGNITERYFDSSMNTIASLNLTKLDAATKEWIKWNNPDSKQPTEGTTNKGIILEGGTFFNFKSAVKSGNQHIVTKLVIEANGQTETLGSNTGPINTRLETDRFFNNKIGIDSNGGIFIHKKNDSTIPITYTITGYYKDIKLGETRLTITNKVVRDLGSVNFKIDKRLLPITGSWIFANGDVASGIDGAYKNYSEMVNLEGNFRNTSNDRIVSVDAMENRTKAHTATKNNVKYQIFNKNNWKDEAAVPFEISLNQLRDNLVVSKYNDTPPLLDNNFTLTANNISYEGNVIEKYSNDDSRERRSQVDLTSLSSANEWVRWDDPNNLTSTGGQKTIVLQGDKLFNFKSGVKSGNQHIVTKLIIKANGQTEVLGSDTGSINTRLETNRFPNNKIGIAINQGIFIHKKTDSTTPVEYTIEGYYKDILLGKTILTVINKKNSFELIGDDTLDFGNMIYDSYNPLYRAEKLFKVKNSNNLDIQFRITSKTGTISKNGETSKQINLENITVSKKTGGSSGETLFLLGASARLDKNTSPGNYTGEIQVIVDIDGTGTN